MSTFKRLFKGILTFTLFIFALSLIVSQVTNRLLIKIDRGYSLESSSLGLLDQLPQMPTLGELLMTTEHGVQYEDRLVGKGVGAKSGDLVRIHYITYLPDGTPFDSSLLHNSPLFFPLGSDGIDEGVVGMKVGGKRTLVIPSELAPGGDAPAERMIYAIQLLSIDEAPMPTKISNYTINESGLMLAMLEEGYGMKAAQGDRVVVHYQAWFEDGTFIDSSLLNQTPLAFTLGKGKVTAAWEEGIQGMQVGETRQLHVPTYLAEDAPPIERLLTNQAIIFEIELLELQPGAILAQLEDMSS